VERNWVHDEIYCYDVIVVTKTFQFSLQLMVNVQDKGKFQVEDINCHYLNMEQCYIEEVEPWTLRFTRDKNLSHLIAAVAEYNDLSIERGKILRNLQSKKYASMEKCNVNGGGIFVYVYPPWGNDEVLFKFQWCTKFVDKTWRIEHIFSIDPVQADEEFIEDNRDVLRGFCKIGLRKNELEKLWSDLCTAIETLQNTAVEDT